MFHVEECPIDAVEKALDLTSELKVGDIPEDFDPGLLRWRELIAQIAKEFSNHGELVEKLDAVLSAAREELCGDCGFIASEPDADYAECPERWLAEHELWTAALDAAERSYQRWLARRAIRRAAANGS
jgi:hypothetical protein